MINKSNSIFNRPWAKDVALVHDSYHCQKFGNNSKPYPSQRKEGQCNFVGCVRGGGTIQNECPEACRPKNHIDWKYC